MRTQYEPNDRILGHYAQNIFTFLKRYNKQGKSGEDLNFDGENGKVNINRKSKFLKVSVVLYYTH